jgi:hypothetical protein
MKQKPVKIKVQFGKLNFLLADENDTQKRDGVAIHMKKRPGGEYQPIATLDDGLFDKYKHCRPQVTSVDWVTE